MARTLRRAAILVAAALAALVAALSLLALLRPQLTAANLHRAEARELSRQIAGLGRLEQAIECGELEKTNQIALGVDTQLLQRLLRLVLPTEAAVGKHLTVRLDQADVRSVAGGIRIHIDGRVWARGHDSIWADLELYGGLGEVTVDPASETLRARMAIDDFAVKRAGHGVSESLSLELLLGALATSGLEALGDTVPPVTIPVGFGQGFAIPGGVAGPFTFRPAEVPLHVAVAFVLPAKDRLWIVLAAQAGPWQIGTAADGATP